MKEKVSNEGAATAGLRLKKSFAGKLNFFQKTMLQWNDIHPYNAVHVVRILAAPGLERLSHVIDTTLESKGLTALTLNRKKGTFRYAGDPARCEIKAVADGENIQAALNAEIGRQLNTAFETGGCFQPFRFFVAPAKQSFFLGLVYFHAVADAGSIVRLLKDICDGYRNDGALRPSESFNLHPGGLRFDPLLLAKKLVAFPAVTRKMKRSLRPVFRNVRDFQNEFTFFSLGPDDLRALIASAKAWEVTLNDLFIALLLKCFSPLLEDRVRGPKRRDIAVGCIVNIRKDLGLDDERTFGLFLGSFVVTHELPRGISVRDLAGDIRRQTLAIKRGKFYVGTPLEMLYGRLAFSFFSTEYRKKLYQKHYPLWGGITNMNLNALWPPRPGETPMDYFRAVSTGPVTPLVLSVTTVRDVVNIGLSHRSTVFSAQNAGQIKNDFLKLVADLKNYA
jgi:NRPS condensation-like uncharacterized protein